MEVDHNKAEQMDTLEWHCSSHVVLVSLKNSATPDEFMCVMILERVV